MQSLYESIKTHRPNLQLSRRCTLELKYFEAQKIQDNKGRTVNAMMLEYRLASGSNKVSLTLFRTVALDQLSSRLGKQLFLHHVQESNGGLLYIYVLLHSSPFVKRKQRAIASESITSDSGNISTEQYPSNIDGSSDDDSQDEKTEPTDQTKPIKDDQVRKVIKDKHHGEVVNSTFDGKTVKICHFVRSSSAQTDAATPHDMPSTSHQVERNPLNSVSNLAICQKKLSNELILHRLNDISNLDRLRQYLAFYSKHPEFGYKGETKHSLRVKLSAYGIQLTDEELMDIYIQHSERHGLTEASARLDIEHLGHMIHTERINYLQRSRDSHQQWMTPFSVTKIVYPDHGLKKSPGRLDPELCNIM